MTWWIVSSIVHFSSGKSSSLYSRSCITQWTLPVPSAVKEDGFEPGTAAVIVCALYHWVAEYNICMYLCTVSKIIKNRYVVRIKCFYITVDRRITLFWDFFMGPPYRLKNTFFGVNGSVSRNLFTSIFSWFEPI